jgi:hypothetical protein
MYCLLCRRKISGWKRMMRNSQFCCDEHREQHKKETLGRLLEYDQALPAHSEDPIHRLHTITSDVLPESGARAGWQLQPFVEIEARRFKLGRSPLSPAGAQQPLLSCRLQYAPPPSPLNLWNHEAQAAAARPDPCGRCIPQVPLAALPELPAAWPGIAEAVREDRAAELRAGSNISPIAAPGLSFGALRPWVDARSLLALQREALCTPDKRIASSAGLLRTPFVILPARGNQKPPAAGAGLPGLQPAQRFAAFASQTTAGAGPHRALSLSATSSAVRLVAVPEAAGSIAFAPLRKQPAMLRPMPAPPAAASARLCCDRALPPSVILAHGPSADVPIRLESLAFASRNEEAAMAGALPTVPAARCTEVPAGLQAAAAFAVRRNEPPAAAHGSAEPFLSGGSGIWPARIPPGVKLPAVPLARSLPRRSQSVPAAGPPSSTLLSEAAALELLAPDIALAPAARAIEAMQGMPGEERPSPQAPGQLVPSMPPLERVRLHGLSAAGIVHPPPGFSYAAPIEAPLSEGNAAPRLACRRPRPEQVSFCACRNALSPAAAARAAAGPEWPDAAGLAFDAKVLPSGCALLAPSSSCEPARLFGIGLPRGMAPAQPCPAMPHPPASPLIPVGLLPPALPQPLAGPLLPRQGSIGPDVRPRLSPVGKLVQGSAELAGFVLPAPAAVFPALPPSLTEPAPTASKAALQVLERSRVRAVPAALRPQLAESPLQIEAGAAARPARSLGAACTILPPACPSACPRDKHSRALGSQGLQQMGACGSFSSAPAALRERALPRSAPPGRNSVPVPAPATALRPKPLLDGGIAPRPVAVARVAVKPPARAGETAFSSSPFAASRPPGPAVASLSDPIEALRSFPEPAPEPVIRALAPADPLREALEEVRRERQNAASRLFERMQDLWQTLLFPALETRRGQIVALSIPALLAFAFVLRLARSPIGAAFDSLARPIVERSYFLMEETFSGNLNAWTDPAPLGRREDGLVQIKEGVTLYRPSLARSNYEFAFAGLIEQGSLSWVVRAADAANYYGFKLTRLGKGKEKRSVLVRFAVCNGAKDEPAKLRVAALPFDLEDNRVYHVLARVQGDQVTTIIDGRGIDSSSDPRLKTGGVGFFSGPGESSLIHSLSVSGNDDQQGRILFWLIGFCRFVSGRS